MTPACAILAAGGSRRLGRPKQLVDVGGQTLVRHVVERICASSCAPIAVVLGADAGDVGAALDGLDVVDLTNDAWETGIASSLRVAAEWACAASAPALVVALADQPLIDAEHVDRLVAEWRSGARAVGSAYGGVVGVPAIFDASLVPELFALEGDRGAASILKRCATATVTWAGGAVDVDTERDVLMMRVHPW